MIRNLCFLGAISCLICVAGTGLYIKQTFAASADAGESPAVAANPFADSKLVPASLLQVSERFSSVLWVELEEGLLHVLRRQQNSSYWQSVASRPVSIGKAGSGKQLEGDNKTPIGIYSVHDFIGDDELIDFYGVGRSHSTIRTNGTVCSVARVRVFGSTAYLNLFARDRG